MDSSNIVILAAVVIGIIIGMLIKLKDTPLSGSEGYKPCPRCSGNNLFKVRKTMWEGQIGPRVFKLTRCGECKTVYNGETGSTALGPRIFLQVTILAAVAALFYFLPVLGNDTQPAPGNTIEETTADFKIPSGTDKEKVKQGMFKTAEATAKKLETTPAIWEVSMTSPLGFLLRMETAKKGDMFRFDLYSGTRKLVTVIDRDGYWYVREHGSRSKKYKPFEAPLQIINFYVFHAISEPRLMTEDTIGLRLKGLENDTAVFSTPDDVDLSFNTKYGYLMTLKLPKVMATLSKFTWKPGMQDDLFSVSGEQWEDCTSDIAGGDLDKLILIANNPVLEYGTKIRDVEVGIFSLASREYRRVPFTNGRMMNGCFSHDRKSVFVMGLSRSNPGLTIYNVDLKSGANTDLIMDKLEPGFVHSPVSSPDGRTLAFVHHWDKKDILKGRIYLLDVPSAELTPLGDRIDAAHLSWLPTGDGIILRELRYEGKSKYGTGYICRMELDGKLIRIRKGNSPRLLGDGKTILFEGEERLWHTCDLEGKNTKLYADGLKGFGFPAVSPDGKRILWMKFAKGQLPIPLICNVGEKDGTVLTSAPGLWAMPVWK